MKNKFQYVIALLGMVVLFCISGGSNVEATYQEEASQIEENKTESAKWFDKELQDKLLILAFSASGAVIGVGVVVKSFKKACDSLKITKKKTEDNEKSIEDTKAEMKKDNLETQNIIKESNDATQKAIKEDNKRTLEAIEKSNKELMDLVNRQSQALILLSKDEHWVKNGTSERVAELLGSDTNGKTN